MSNGRYLFNEKATRDAHDIEGYFKTGDIVRSEGDHYFILGRASIDIIKSGGYKLSALDIEREMLSLNYVSEVMVVGVDDDEYGQRVAALVRPKAGSGVPAVTLSKVRNDLRGRLTGYKMPTILRLTADEIPKSPAGKVQKKILGPRFFPANYRALADVQVWTKETRAKL
jgi:malonyl-CoA/methylmalonyl-CoA synthetase